MGLGTSVLQSFLLYKPGIYAKTQIENWNLSTGT